jgi:hypothetical protein
MSPARDDGEAATDGKGESERDELLTERLFSIEFRPTRTGLGVPTGARDASPCEGGAPGIVASMLLGSDTNRLGCGAPSPQLRNVALMSGDETELNSPMPWPSSAPNGGGMGEDEIGRRLLLLSMLLVPYRRDRPEYW